MKQYQVLFFFVLLAMGIHKPIGVMAQVPAATLYYFKQVDQMVWVVKDLNRVISKWKKLGYDQVVELGVVKATVLKGRKEVKLKMAQANLGGALVSWIQPLEENSLFAQFHGSYGDGGMSLVYQLNSKEEVQEEVRRLGVQGIQEADEVTIHTPYGLLNYVFMDTRKEGKYFLGYTFGQVEKKITGALTDGNKFAMRQSQYAFVAKDPQSVSNFWQKTGMPPLAEAKPDISDKMYHGAPANYDLKQGWQKQGRVPYEWCFSLRGPNVYIDHLIHHGEGIHHLGFNVKDMDEVIRDYESKGFHFSMSGSWGEKGKPGSGRFAYVDLEGAGGVTMELLWNYGD